MDLEKAVIRHRPLVEKAARIHWARVQGRTWLGYEDLLQAGYVGLLFGLKRYDPTTGNAESTFLWPTVYGHILKEIAEHNHSLRVGERFKRYASKIHASDDQDEDAWAVKLGVSVAEIRVMKTYLATEIQSMDYEIETAETTLHDVVGKRDESYDESEVRERIESACISELDRAIIRLREQGYNNTEIVDMVQEKGNSRWKRSKNMKQISETLRRIRRRMRKGEQA